MLRISTAYFATAPVRPAPLPTGAGQGGADRRDQAAVGIGDDQLDAGQPASRPGPEEGEPAGAVLIAGDLQTQHLPATVGVHADRNQSVHIHRPPVLANP